MLCLKKTAQSVTASLVLFWYPSCRNTETSPCGRDLLALCQLQLAKFSKICHWEARCYTATLTVIRILLSIKDNVKSLQGRKK